MDAFLNWLEILVTVFAAATMALAFFAMLGATVFLIESYRYSKQEHSRHWRMLGITLGVFSLGVTVITYASVYGGLW